MPLLIEIETIYLSFTIDSNDTIAWFVKGSHKNCISAVMKQNNIKICTKYCNCTNHGNERFDSLYKYCQFQLFNK